ncbi:MAG TPA: hypothetical protein VGC14_12685 [Rhizobium sp.]
MIFYSSSPAEMFRAGADMAGMVAAVSSAIAYASGMETSRITVSHEHGVLFLDGVAADRKAMENAWSIANHIAACPVRMLFEAISEQCSTKAAGSV